MALPKLDLPIFELTLPSSGEKIKYRPFTVKEEKILLVAQQDDDPAQTIIAIKQIANNCLIDHDVTDIPMFDLEYVLMVLRARSVDNTVKFSIQDPDTEEKVELEINLDEVTVTKDESHTNKVSINEDYALYLKYPSIDEFIKITSLASDDPLSSYFIMVSCLDYVASEDEVHYFKDHTEKEVDSFMEDVSAEVVKGIQTFFETMPKLRHEMKYKNSLGEEKTFVVEGIRSFFT